jgi:hypothetical protein
MFDDTILVYHNNNNVFLFSDHEQSYHILSRYNVNPIDTRLSHGNIFKMLSPSP